ncbi:MAG TPA: DUF4252 domain-containing protein [Flavobacterium sp.]|nr:DUF4252 domain-containing protein [Flavobacterium sp.]
MKNILTAAFLSLMFMSCNSEPSLQKYFVEKAESKDFIALDLGTDILKVDKSKLSAEESSALETLKKMNILAFKADGKNQKQLDIETKNVNAILKNEKDQELIKINSGKEGGAVYFVGEGNAIDEFILYANKKDAGFALVRVLGEDMNANSVMTMISILQKANLNMEQLKPLGKMLVK